jgi:hypothetical protein
MQSRSAVRGHRFYEVRRVRAGAEILGADRWVGCMTNIDPARCAKGSDTVGRASFPDGATSRQHTGTPNRPT